MSLRDSAASGSRIATLQDLRDLLAGQIESCDSMRDLAALSARLTDVLAQIDAIAPTKTEGDPVDEITARRSARGAVATPSPTRAKRSS